mmetsp:Transcript_95246/g.308469  ORF Transcript_95246/g.308469 Transcript_95246/m.308469 type:complete len:280 (+) Transcript_95246:1072-1911(+)
MWRARGNRGPIALHEPRAVWLRHAVLPQLCQVDLVGLSADVQTHGERTGEGGAIHDAALRGAEGVPIPAPVPAVLPHNCRRCCRASCRRRICRSPRDIFRSCCWANLGVLRLPWLLVLLVVMLVLWVQLLLLSATNPAGRSRVIEAPLLHVLEIEDIRLAADVQVDVWGLHPHWICRFNHRGDVRWKCMPPVARALELPSESAPDRGHRDGMAQPPGPRLQKPSRRQRRTSRARREQVGDVRVAVGGAVEVVVRHQARFPRRSPVARPAIRMASSNWVG